MSQHYFSTEKDGKAISILIGWDRPLQGFFLVVTKVLTREERKANLDDEGSLYSNLDDPALDQYMGLPRSMDHFIRKLEELQIQVPASMIVEVEADALLNAGNRQRWHTFDEVSDRPIK